MESNNELELKFAEEFRVACTINNLRYGDVLQSFVSSASYYVFVGGEIDAACQLATNVIIDCKEELNGKELMISNEDIRQASLKYVELLTDLSNAEHLSIQTKAKKCDMMMQSWSDAIANKTHYLEKVEVNSNYTLNISFDFYMLCSMNGVNTEQVLQYFINTISLAEDRALNLYEMIKVSPGTAFILLLLVKDNDCTDRRLPQEHIYVKYGLKLLNLDEILEEEREFGDRVKAYRNLYQEWYNALRVIVN